MRRGAPANLESVGPHSRGGALTRQAALRDEAAARAFFGWEGLRDAMAQGGVVGEPQLGWFGKVVERDGG
jgi:hypothetical protein